MCRWLAGLICTMSTWPFHPTICNTTARSATQTRSTTVVFRLMLKHASTVYKPNSPFCKQVSETAVLIANCGLAGKGMHSTWHKALATQLANSCHVVASCNCEGSRDLQDLIARKTVEACSMSPYASRIRRWFFIGMVPLELLFSISPPATDYLPQWCLRPYSPSM